MNKKTKVLFIGPLPPPYSGPELGMKQFFESEALNDCFDIHFLQTNFRKSNEKKGKFGLVMVFNFFKFFIRLKAKLLFSGVKVVYYPVTPTQIGWIGRDTWTILLCKLFGKKVVIHLRGSHFKLNFQEFSPWAQKITALALRKTDHAIVQAHYLKDQFAPFIPEKKVSVLYQAMDTREYQNKDLQKYQKGKILVVGHMTKAKGYTDILKIIPDIAKEFPYVQFCFAGNIRKGERGVFYNQLTGEKISYEDPVEAEREILNSPYSKNYQNLEIVYGEEKNRHFKECDIFVTASYSEGFSRSLLEAMSMGKPLVYTPVGAHREVLAHKVNGIQVDPGNLEQLKNGIRALLKNNRLRNRIAEENYRKVRQDFDIGTIAGQFKGILLKQI